MLPEDNLQDVNFPRCKLDKIVNEYGKLVLDFCKLSGRMVRRLGSDRNIRNNPSSATTSTTLMSATSISTVRDKKLSLG